VTVSSSPNAIDGVYNAGASLTLSCLVGGGHQPLSYIWNSTCVGECFVNNQTSQSIRTAILQSTDSGVHTCIVTDFVGHRGNASINMTVAGMSGLSPIHILQPTSAKRPTAYSIQ